MKFWTKEEIEFLSENTQLTIKQLAKCLKRTKPSIIAMKQRLKICKKQWNKNDENLLIQLFSQDKKLEQLYQELKTKGLLKTKQEIKSKIKHLKRIGLLKTFPKKTTVWTSLQILKVKELLNQNLSIPQIAKELNKSYSSIYSIIKRIDF